MILTTFVHIYVSFLLSHTFPSKDPTSTTNSGMPWLSNSPSLPLEKPMKQEWIDDHTLGNLYHNLFHKVMSTFEQENVPS